MYTCLQWPRSVFLVMCCTKAFQWVIVFLLSGRVIWPDREEAQGHRQMCFWFLGALPNPVAAGIVYFSTVSKAYLSYITNMGLKQVNNWPLKTHTQSQQIFCGSKLWEPRQTTGSQNNLVNNYNSECLFGGRQHTSMKSNQSNRGLTTTPSLGSGVPIQ